jgi:hypothetical protein
MKRLILITALIIIAKITFAHIYNIPSFIWEIQEQYANERHDIVKIKLENEGFNLIKTMPIMMRVKNNIKYLLLQLKNSFEYMLFDFITTIENEVIAYELNITIKIRHKRN